MINTARHASYNIDDNDKDSKDCLLGTYLLEALIDLQGAPRCL